MIILGIACFGMHDSSAALLIDGKLIAYAEEERFNRKKFYAGFPVKAIDYCLKSNNLKIDNVDYIAYFMDITSKIQFEYLSFFLKNMPNSLAMAVNRSSMINNMKNIKSFIRKYLKFKGKVICVEHHLSHAANAFLLSPFETASILTIDGVGEIDSIVWAQGNQNKIEKLHSNKFPHSLGHVYLSITQYLGFMPNSDEYKVMGLASYGNPEYIDLFRKIISIKGRDVIIDLSYFNFQYGRETRFSKKLVKELGPARIKQEPVSQKHKDIASSLQLRLEEVVIELVNQLVELTKEKNLCLAGGVALNSAANGKIAALKSVKSLYIPPTASDAGCSIGAAFYLYNCLLNNKRSFLLDRADFGPSYSNLEIEEALHEFKLPFSRPGDLNREVAQVIAQGKVIGWFQGRMEAGQRALGFRSILADPRIASMKDTVNLKVKFREEFRPFAPAILEEKFKEYFETDMESSPFMTMVFPVKRKDIPAVTHVDGTGRAQTVSKATNPKFWGLINEFYKISGVPVLLNTSFNSKAEPIVNTPKEAINCFLKTEIDYLVLNDLLVSKPKGCIIPDTSAHDEDFENTAEEPKRCRDILLRKKSVMFLYNGFYKQILAQVDRSGKTLELGSGPGFLKDHLQDLVTSDILYLPWTDMELNAESLPFKSGTFSNVVLIHVLHHLHNIPKVISEVSRVLKPGGKVIIIDHQLGVLSYLFMKFIHHELFDLKDEKARTEGLNTRYSNTAIPHFLIQENTDFWEKEGLHITKIKYHTLFSYLLTGGYTKFNFLPGFLCGTVKKLDEAVFDNKRTFSMLMTAVFEKGL